MKAIHVSEFGGPEVLKVVEVADPEPVAGEVLIDVKAIGVNPVEVYIRSGKFGPRMFPYLPGSDAAGVVLRTGPGVTSVRPGQRVYVWSLAGAYAQRIVAAENRVYPLPDRATFVEGACLGVPAATAYQALFNRGEAKAGQTLFVHGATGGVGSAAVQLARAAGLTVIGSGGTEEGRKLILRLGCHFVVDHHAPDYLAQVRQMTDGKGVDLILEMLANVNLAKDLEILAKFGKVVVIGSRGTVEIDPRLAMAGDADIRGMILFNATEEQLRGIHAALYAALEAGTLTPVIGREFPLAEAAKAHEEVMSAHAPGNILLTP